MRIQKSMEELVKGYARGTSVLFVDDDLMSLEIYKKDFGGVFSNIYTATNGQEAYDMWLNNSFDLIITNIIMPVMDGFELIEKIRLKSPYQKIIVVSTIEDANELKNIINLGIDGMLIKPYNIDKMFGILRRVLKVIYDTKILKKQSNQLKLLSKDNIELKTTIHSSVKDLGPDFIDVKLSMKDSARKIKPNLVDKYNIRQTTSNSEKLTPEIMKLLEYYNMEQIEVFKDNISKYETTICETEFIQDGKQIKDELQKVFIGFYELIDILNHFGIFTVTINATEKLIDFIEKVDPVFLEDENKKELFVTILLALFEDLTAWIETIFINKEIKNINYFDASFANTCLELESVFADINISDSGEEDLEFF